MNKNIDKYLIICCFSFIIVFSFAFMYNGVEGSDDDIIGVVIEMRESDSGFVFDIEDCSGMQYHCFAKNQIERNGVYRLSGSFSKDNSIFFVSEMMRLG